MASEQKTRCPHCHTAFRVTRSQLEAATGMVRCGKCYKAFNGIEHLVADAPVHATTAHGTTEHATTDSAAVVRPAAVEATSIPEDDFLIDDNFDVSRLENPATGNQAPVTGNPDASRQQDSHPRDDDFLIDDNFDVSRLTDGDSHPVAAPVFEQAPCSETPPVDPLPPVADPSGDYATPSPTVESQQIEVSTVAAFAVATTGEPAANADGRAPEATPTNTSATVESIVFDAGLPIATLTADLEDLKLDKRSMSRWRPETHNIIPDAGLLGRTPSRRDPHSWLWLIGSAIAAATLGLQLVYFNSLLISRDSPLWRLSSTLCPALGCPLPSTVNVEKILSTNLVIRSHPDVAGALLVDAVIVNMAKFAQPFPPLTLTFENLQGDILAQRTFNPEEYLMGELSGMAEMPSKKPVKLELEIVDPGKDAVSFRLFIAK